ncbi:MAG: glycosyltransferase [Betaproteobacteria bacterium]
MSRKLRLIVMGILGRTPLAGVSWQVLHFLEGFRRLGHDVYYIEDTGGWAYHPLRTNADHEAEDAYEINLQYAVSHVARVMSSHGLEDRWAYRSRVDDRIFGLSKTQVSNAFENADALVNLTGSTQLLEEHARVPVRIYIETDPVLPQIEVAQGDRKRIDLLSAHTHHFTYGENLGAPDCGVPVTRFKYLPIRQPIVLDWWTTDAQPVSALNDRPEVRPYFTTIAKWRQPGKDIDWNGETYSWSKHVEFLKFIDLPRCSKQEFELALAWQDEKDQQAIPQLKSHGWRIIDGISLSLDTAPYREYILRSRGEFTVAKDQNIRLRSGWFSDRSACYLAAGKPVVTQDTAFGNILPVGRGLFAFRNMDDILTAIETIEGDYDRHSRAAREIAQEYFATENVLRSLMERVGL